MTDADALKSSPPLASGTGAEADPGGSCRRIGVVLKGYPRLSETFIAQELLGLEGAGRRLSLISLRHPTDRETHPVHDRITAPVRYLPEYLHREPWRVLRGIGVACRRPGFRAALRLWLRDLRREATPNRVRRFGQACVLARDLAHDPALREVDWLHAHFIHTPASVARYAAVMTGLPFSISAHAKDIWTSPAWDTRQKVAEGVFTAACTQDGAAKLSHLAAPAGAEDRVHLIHHGLSPDRIPSTPPAPRSATVDGSDRAAPVTVLSVGRLVEKKGYDDLLEALASLPEGLHWRFEHVGGGPLGAALRNRAAALGLSDRIEWRGAQSQDAVVAAMDRADLFVLASKVARDGDRDGLPNVLMEAAARRLACLSTDLPGIAELITHGETGWLAPPGDVEALGVGLVALARDPALRHRLAGAAARRLETHFDFEKGLERLAALLPETVAGAAR